MTARAAVGTDDDEPLLLAALSEEGAVVEVVEWDDPVADWSAFDLAVVRSTWDYTLRRDAFLVWATATAGRTRLRNGPDVLAWNTDKTYLGELAAAGVPVVPTTFLTPDDELRPPAGDGDFVVKPSVSAGSRDTARYTAGEAAAARNHAQRLLNAGRTVLVQPYQDSVDIRGETALMFVNGRFSHAARKAALLAVGRPPTPEKLFATETMAAAVPTSAEREVADAVLAATPFGPTELLYARVDLLQGSAGRPLLLELELVEPSMFLPYAPAQAVSRFAAAIAAAASPGA
ncbi:MAG: ATP-grasp domain-containing protein [Pseudonocardiaceae bacterium]